MGNLIFKECGCKFKTKNDTNIEVDEYLSQAPIEFSVDNINYACHKTWELLCSGNTIGVFQLEKSEGKQWTSKVKPTSIKDMGHLNALLRPGCPPFMKHEYCNVKHGKNEPQYIHPLLEPIFKDTHSVLLLQEQSMRIAVDIAGFTPQESDSLRKSIGKKMPEEMAKLKDKFINGCIKHSNLEKNIAEEIFSWIEQGQSYQFNFAHGICYGMLGYWCAYIKTHFPAQFYCAWLHITSNKQDQSDDVNILVNDAKMNDIDVLPPSLLHSKKYPSVKDNNVILGILNIKGIGYKTAEKIITHVNELKQQKEHEKWIDFLVYVGSKIPISACEALIHSGFLDYTNKHRRSMIHEIGIWHGLVKREQNWIINEYKQRKNEYGQLYSLLNWCARPKKDGGGCSNINRINKVKNYAQICKHPPFDTKDTIDFIVWGEEKHLGIPLTYHDTDTYENSMMANTQCREVASCSKKYIVVAAKIRTKKEIVVKRGNSAGKKMAFLSLEDASGLIEVAVFPNVYSEFADKIQQDAIILARLSKGKNGGIFIEKIQDER